MENKSLVVDNGDNFTFKDFLEEVCSKRRSLEEMIAFIKEASPRCFWIMPDCIVIKRIKPNYKVYVEKRKFSELTLPQSSNFDLQNLMMIYGQRIEDVRDVEGRPGFLALSKCKTINELQEVDMKLIEPVLNFILEVWANNDKQKYEYILSWFNVAFGCGINRAALLFYSASNKTLHSARYLLNWMKNFVIDEWHESNQVVINPDKEIVVINSNKCVNDDALDELIDAINDDSIDNHANYIITTTSLDAFPIAGKECFMCLEVGNKHTNDAEYLEDLQEIIGKDEVASHFYTYIRKYEVSNESRKFISTELEKKMVRMSFEMRYLYLLKDYGRWDQKTNVEFWQPLIDAECLSCNGYLMDNSVLYEAYCGYCKVQARMPVLYAEFKQFTDGKVNQFGEVMI